jgi:hypothetical protein
MSLTFKQYHAFLEAPLDEADQINEIWPFKNAEEKAKAEREKLVLLAKKGDLKAKMKLADIEKAEALAAAKKAATEKEKNERFATAKAHAEVADRGSSRAYDKEAGSADRKKAPYWDRQQNRWVKPGEDAWAHVGKHH